jgi:hypothetical protein
MRDQKKKRRFTAEDTENAGKKMALINYMKFGFSEPSGFSAPAPDHDPGIPAASRLAGNLHDNSNTPKTVVVFSDQNQNHIALLSRYNRLAPYLFCFWLIFIHGLAPCFADDVAAPFDFLRDPKITGYSRAQIFALNFFATVIIEYVVICWFFAWSKKVMAKLLFAVVVLNIITNPAAQAGAIFFATSLESETLAWTMIWIIEFLVVAVEFGLLKWIFRYMYRQGALDEEVTPKRTLLIAAVANLASFAFGFLGTLVVLTVTVTPWVVF